METVSKAALACIALAALAAWAQITRIPGNPAGTFQVIPFTGGGASCCTFYSDSAGGSDSNAGTLAAPFQNVPGMAACAANCAAVTLAPGQSVGLRAGSVWRQTLTPAQSGAAGNPITYATYGAGARACIYCEPAGFFTATADTGDTSEWTSVIPAGASTFTATQAAVYHASGPGATGYGFDALSDGTNFAYASKTITAVATLWVKFYIFIPPSFAQVNFNQIYIFNLNSAGTAKLHMYLQQQSAGQFQLHSQLNFGSFTNYGTANFTAGAWHRVDVEYVASATVGGQQFWFDGASQGSIFTQNNPGNIDAIQLGMINTTAPNAGSHLYFDTLKAAMTSLVAANNAVDISKNWITLNNLEIANAGDVGVYLHGGASNVVVANSAIHDIDANAFRAAIFANGSSGDTWQGNTIYNAEDGAAVSGFGSVANSNIKILANTFYNFGRHAVQVAPAGGTAPDHVTVNSNSLSYASLWVNDSVGILLDGPGAGNNANYNVSFNHGTPVYIGSGYDSDLLSAGNSWTWNVGYGSTNGCFILSGTGHFIYHNTCYNNNVQAASDGEISLYTNAATITAKNNIFSCSAGRPVLSIPAGSTTGHAFDYNDFYCATATPFSYAGTNYSFANYQTTAAQDAHSITANPLFANPPVDFTLQTGSPAIGAGVFISGVSTANPPNMGAK